MQNQILTARAPAKLILSGEHAVLHGSPAIAFAVNRYAFTQVNPNNIKNSILLDLLNFSNAKKFTLKTLKELKKRLQESYINYQNGECTIKEVLQTPFDLINFTLTNLLEKFNVKLSHGMSVTTQSDIPIGCGMGSSAATIVSLLYALSNMLGLDLCKTKYLQLAKDAENLQHGKSSGLDLYLSLHGGSIVYKDQKAYNNTLNQKDFYIVNTGEPKSSTGDAVGFTEKFFNKSNLVDDFSNITSELELLLARDIIDFLEIKKLIQENHRLLNKIKIVPEKVNNFILDLEKNNACAKVCGAGAIKGDNAGVVMVFAEDINSIKNIVDKYNYKLDSVSIDNNGTEILTNNNQNIEFSELSKVVNC